MKQYAITGIVIALSVACSKQPKGAILHESCMVSVIEDVTDPHLLHAAPMPILSLYAFAQNKNKEAWFRLQHITDMQLGAVKEFHLASGEVTNIENTFDDPWHRERLIQAFYDSVTMAIMHSTKDVKIGKNYSECYQRIAAELRYLSHCTASKKVLLVFSDLKENQVAFSSYRKADITLVRSYPDSVASMFFKQYPLPEALSGFDIFLIYQGKSREDEDGFLLHSKLYRQILESRGAKVIVQADNDKFK